MAALREVVAQFDVRINGAKQLDAVDAKLNKTKASANKAIFSFGKLGAALAGAFAIRGVASFFRSQADLGLQLDSNAQLLGMSVEQLQKWQYASNMSGNSAEEMTNSIAHFNHAIGLAGTEQGKTYTEALQRMGIQTHGLNGKMKSTHELLLDFADGLQKLKSPQERMGYAMQLAGRGGKIFADVLGDGRGALEDLMKKADDAGLILGRDFTDASKKAEQNSIKLDWSWRALKGTLAQALFPWFTKIVDYGTKFVKAFQDIVKHTTFAKSAFVALGVAIALANWEILAIVAAVGIVYLAFDDLFSLFSGNKSYIGDTIDEFSGLGTAKDMVQDLTDAWNNLSDALFGYRDAADQAGESMSFIGVLKATIGQVILVVSTGLGVIFNWLALIVNEAKGVWGALHGRDTSKTDMAAQHNIEGMIKGTKKFGSLLELDNVKSANQMNPEEWYNLNHLGHMPKRKPISVETSSIGANGKRVTHVTVHNHINATGGDPHKIRAAVHQGTSDALSQNDLRHAHQASRSMAPAVNQ